MNVPFSLGVAFSEGMNSEKNKTSRLLTFKTETVGLAKLTER
jgi:hypothetical protein